MFSYLAHHATGSRGNGILRLYQGRGIDNGVTGNPQVLGRCFLPPPRGVYRSGNLSLSCVTDGTGAWSLSMNPVLVCPAAGNLSLYCVLMVALIGDFVRPRRGCRSALF